MRDFLELVKYWFNFIISISFFILKLMFFKNICINFWHHSDWLFFQLCIDFLKLFFTLFILITTIGTLFVLAFLTFSFFLRMNSTRFWISKIFQKIRFFGTLRIFNFWISHLFLHNIHNFKILILFVNIR